MSVVYNTFNLQRHLVSRSTLRIFRAKAVDCIESVLLPQCDFVFDFHSGGSSLTYVPSALMRRPQTPAALAQGIEMLRTFDAPVAYLVDAALGDHTLTAAAARAGVRHMSTELAGGAR